MSWNSSRRKALDEAANPLWRMSAARSCAMLVAFKWRVKRSDVLRRVLDGTGVDLTRPAASDEIAKAMAALDQLRMEGLAPPDGP